MLQTNKKDNKKIEYIALYCRVATPNREASQLAIEGQKKLLTEWALKQGFSQEQIVYLIDIGFSGLTLDRPGIQEFLSGKRNYIAVAAVDFSRFCRDIVLADDLIGYADIQGITLYAVNEKLNLNRWKRRRNQRWYALLKGGAAQ